MICKGKFWGCECEYRCWISGVGASDDRDRSTVKSYVIALRCRFRNKRHVLLRFCHGLLYCFVGRLTNLV